MVTTVSPRPVQCRSGEPDDRELFGRVYRKARCATSCLEPDKWFPLTADVGRAREQAARAIAICAGCPVRADCLELSLRALFRSLTPASISSAAASRTCSRRARSRAVSPPPSGYLMTPAYRDAAAITRGSDPQN